MHRQAFLIRLCRNTARTRGYRSFEADSSIRWRRFLNKGQLGDDIHGIIENARDAFAKIAMELQAKETGTHLIICVLSERLFTCLFGSHKTKMAAGQEFVM